MSRADRTKQHVLDHYVKPSRAPNGTTATVRVGDVHQQMGLKQRQSATCAVLGSNEFETLTHVKRACIMSPLAASTCVFVFKLL